MFYTRYIFKHKRPRFIPPGKIDEVFYAEIREQIAKNPDLKFESEINFWQSYKYIFFVFLIFLTSIILLLLLPVLDARENNLLYGFLIFFIIICLQPSIYFMILMVYYVKYLKDERKYQIVFKKAVMKSTDFVSFSEAFYTGPYSEMLTITEYLFENDIFSIKEFAEGKSWSERLAIYRFSNSPPAYVILSSDKEIDRYIESKDGYRKIIKGEKIRWIIKYQVDIPCIYGNKKLKKLIELNTD